MKVFKKVALFAMILGFVSSASFAADAAKTGEVAASDCQTKSNVNGDKASAGSDVKVDKSDASKAGKTE